MEALGCVSEGADLTSSGTVVTGGVEALMFAGTTTSRAGATGNSTLVGQGAIGKFGHGVVWDYLEASSGS
jgi:hypothetical protein